MLPAPPPRSRRLPEVAGIAAVVLLAFLPLLVVAVVTGAWGIPHNDDWDYTRAALTLHSTGQIQLSGWSQMTLVGQLLISQPLLFLHDSIATLDALGLLSAVGFVVAVWFLARTLLRPGWALLAAGVAAFCPLTAILSTTFMTDLPSASLQALCLALGALAFTRRPAPARGYSTGLFVGAMAAGLVACTIRETAAAAPLAVWLVALHEAWRARRRLFDPVVLLPGVAVAAGLAAALEWRRSQPGASKIGLSLLSHPHAVTIGMLEQLSVLALCLLPLLAALPWLRLGRAAGRAGAVLGGVLGLAGGAAAWNLAEGSKLFPGNLLMSVGPEGPHILAGTRPDLFTTGQWIDLERLAAVAFGLLLAACVLGGSAALRRRRTTGEAADRPSVRPQLLLVATAAVTMLFGLLASLLSATILATRPEGYDRYVLPILIPFTVLVGWIGQDAAGPAGRRRAVHASSAAPAPSPTRYVRASLAALLVVMLAALGYVETASGDAFDGARWHAGEVLLAGHPGVPPGRFDAGFEWVGFHTPLPLKAPYIETGWTFYEDIFGLRVCAVVSSSPTIAARGEPAAPPGRPIGSWTDAYGRVHDLYVIDVAPCTAQESNGATSGG